MSGDSLGHKHSICFAVSWGDGHFCSFSWSLNQFPNESNMTLEVFRIYRLGK